MEMTCFGPMISWCESYAVSGRGLPKQHQPFRLVQSNGKLRCSKPILLPRARALRSPSCGSLCSPTPY